MAKLPKFYRLNPEIMDKEYLFNIFELSLAYNRIYRAYENRIGYEQKSTHVSLHIGSFTPFRKDDLIEVDPEEITLKIVHKDKTIMIEHFPEQLESCDIYFKNYDISDITPEICCRVDNLGDLFYETLLETHTKILPSMCHVDIHRGQIVYLNMDNVSSLVRPELFHYLLAHGITSNTPLVVEEIAQSFVQVSSDQLEEGVGIPINMLQFSNLNFVIPKLYIIKERNKCHFEFINTYAPSLMLEFKSGSSKQLTW